MGNTVSLLFYFCSFKHNKYLVISCIYDWMDVLCGISTYFMVDYE